MTPNIMKSNKDTTKFAPEAPDSIKAQTHDAPRQPSGMDSDHAGKTLDNAATNTAVASDMTEGLHETAKRGDAAAAKATGHRASMLNAQGGSIGQAFTEKGAIGGAAQSIGGPFDKQGMIGKHFTTGGAIGGTAQGLAEKNESH